MSTFRNIMLAGVLGLGLGLSGCSAFDNDHDRDHHSSRDYDRYDNTRTSGDVERAAGAATHLPRDARMVDEVKGGKLSFVARDSGEAYVYDANARTVVWSGHVRDGDRLTVNPDKNRIEINGRDQADIDLKSNHRFEVYTLDRYR
jgi:hypothetical protein